LFNLTMTVCPGVRGETVKKLLRAWIVVVDTVEVWALLGDARGGGLG
jgi:hypothetical protein